MIYDDTICQLGEGPLWHPELNDLFWFDILSKRLHRKGRYWQFDRPVSAAGWVSDSTLMIADSASLFLFDLSSETRTHLCDLEADNPTTRSNDGRADPWGGFWIGTMGLDAQPGAGSIYRYYRGELRRLFSGLTITNAICFAPDRSCAYFTDTTTNIIQRQPLSEPDGWPVGEPEVFLDLRDKPFHPDGAVVDEQGRFWNAQWGFGQVACIGPDGQLIDTIPVPGKQATCPAFGGPDRSTLYCTSAAVGLDGGDHGKTFAIETGSRGQAEHRVIP